MKRLFAITAVLVLAFGLAAWACEPELPDIYVDANGCGNVLITETLVTKQGALFESIGVSGEFYLDKSVDLWPCGQFTEDKHLEVFGSVDFFELVSVNQPFYQMSAYVDIEATSPPPGKGEGLVIEKTVTVLQPPPCGNEFSPIDMELWVSGSVEEGTFAVGHSGFAAWATCGSWGILQDFTYDLNTLFGTTDVYVEQGATLGANVLYEFSTAAVVLNDTVDLYARVYDEIWSP